MPISAARLAAFAILLRVEKQGAYASELLHSERLAALSAADRGLCTELVMGALRWQSALDDDIQAVSSQKLNRIDAEVLVALRLGAYQLRFLDRIPAHAAVNESVELVKRARKKSAAPFANAVLRKLIGKRGDGKTTGGGFVRDAEAESPEALAAAWAHPPWLVARWAFEFGSERAHRICQFDQQAPPLALRLLASGRFPPQQVNSGLVGDPGEAIEAQLRAQGVELAPGRLLRSARVVLSATGSPTRAVVARVGVEGDVTHTPAYLEHRLAIQIQDEGSQLVGALVGKGSRILDCCAAPGNKTAALAEANPGAAIVAVELHPHRAEQLRKRMAALTAVQVITADATALPYGREFDRILADVPCSGTGTLARNPEIKWKLRPDDLTDLHARQKAILGAALRYLAAGGVIVYTTCSLEAEENAAVVEEVLREHPAARLLDCGARLHEMQAEGELTWPDVESLTSGPYLRTLPGTHPCDGFFAAMITA
jgi:16S rRNA (cytosine967-C5)-methyltransferase